MDIKLGKLLRDELAPARWLVVRHAGMAIGQMLIEGRIRYDLFVLDDETGGIPDLGLPATTGLEAARFIRSVAHRRRKPILLLMSKDCSQEAQEAGVNKVLKKRKDQFALAKEIKQWVVAQKIRRAKD